MAIYKIEIEETLQRIIEVQAVDKYEALKKIHELYNEGALVLDYSDFKSVEIKEYVEFKKLQKAERKEAETFLSKKYDLLKRIKFKEEGDVKQPAPKKVQPTRKPKQKSN